MYELEFNTSMTDPFMPCYYNNGPNIINTFENLVQECKLT